MIRCWKAESKEFSALVEETFERIFSWPTRGGFYIVRDMWRMVFSTGVGRDLRIIFQSTATLFFAGNPNLISSASRYKTSGVVCEEIRAVRTDQGKFCIFQGEWQRTPYGYFDSCV
jgi:hypothetical protein